MFGAPVKKCYAKRRCTLAALFLGTALSLYTPRAAAQGTLSQDRGATVHGPKGAHACGSEASTARRKTPGELLKQNKKLSEKLSAILRQQNPPVADLQVASQGFRNLSVFVVAVHVSQNLGIPFDQLKSQKLTSGTLGKAIHVLKPDVDANAEIWKAAEQTVDDMRKSAPES